MKTQRRKILLLSIVLVLFISSTVFSKEGSVAIRTQPLSDIRIDGNNAVWMAGSGGNLNIYHLDLTTGVETQITNIPGIQGYPDIWQNYIVWQDNRNYLENPGNYDIYLYDMEKKTEQKISNIEGNHREPIIKNNRVVWVDHKDGNKDIMLYDIKNATLERVSSDGAQAFGLSFDGNIIAWMDHRGKTFDIYIYDISKREEKQITYGLGDESDPIVNDGKVVWMVGYDGFSQVYMYDTKTDLRTKLTVGEENHRPIAFSNNMLLVIENDRLVLNTTDRITEQSITSPGGIVPKQAFIDNDRVIWFDGNTLVVDSIDNALNRKPNDKIPSPNDTTVVEKIKEEKKGMLVKADKETILTSEDGVLTLKFQKGSFDKDVYVIINQKDKLQKTSYTPISKVYSWEVEGNIKPSLPIEVSMNYSNIKTTDNPRKICIYALNNDNSLKRILSSRDYGNNILTAKLTNENNITLMIYNKAFTDMNNHWAKETVDIISSHEIINGYTDGSFKPNKEISRAEFVKILVSSIYTEEEILSYTNKNVFNDVPPEFWAAPYINIASQRGWISGYNGSFSPNQLITREQMVAILIRALEDIEANNLNNQAEVDLSAYKDTEKISAWAYEAMKKAVGNGIIQGNNNELQPLKNATRAEAATILYRYLEKLQRL